MESLLNCESTESDSQELMFRVRSYNLRVELLRPLGLTAIDSRLVCVIAAVEKSVWPIDGEPMGSAHFTSVHTGFHLISLIALKCQVSGSSIVAHFP